MRSEKEIESVRTIFISAGDDPPALNTAVRDTLTWVLGCISTEELIDEYFATGEDYQCFTCPAVTPEPSAPAAGQYREGASAGLA